jgi:coiled-coil domain-containing protein 63/114
VGWVQETKKEMAKIISVIAKAAEAREAALTEMAALKARADKEQAAFEAEWKKLGSIIDQDKRSRDLLRQREMEERNRKTQEVRSSGMPDSELL